MLILRDDSNGKYFDGDLNYLINYNQSLTPLNPHWLDLNLYPEPFAGNANALVYILSGNPGWSPYDYQLMQINEPLWGQMMRASYNPLTANMYWLDHTLSPKIQPVQITVNGQIKDYTGGFGWWEPRTRKLREELANRGKQLGLNYNPADKLHERLFNIDYHPYHSKNLKIGNNIQSLPSMNEVDNILKRALNNPDRLFIIVRCRKLWEDRLKNILGIPQTSPFPNQQYPNVIMLKNPRCAYLTKNNMIINNTRNDWNRLVDTLTK